MLVELEQNKIEEFNLDRNKKHYTLEFTSGYKYAEFLKWINMELAGLFDIKCYAGSPEMIFSLSLEDAVMIKLTWFLSDDDKIN